MDDSSNLLIQKEIVMKFLNNFWTKTAQFLAEFIEASSAITPHNGALYCCSGCIMNCE